jgi:hypothetical protein
VRGQGSEQSGADPRHPVEPFQASKRAFSLPIRYQSLCECEAHPRQASQFGRRCEIGINQLARCQRPGLVHGTFALSRW